MKLYDKIIYWCLLSIIMLTAIQILATIYVILGGRLG